MNQSERSAKRNKLIWLATALCLSISQSNSALAISKADESKLAVVEKKLFFKNYLEEPLDKRIARIEKRFFGEASSGSLEERIVKVFAAAGPQIDADGSVTRGNLTEPEKPQQQQPATGSTESPGPAVPKVDEAEAAWEQANINAVNARDAEIRNLLKEGIKLWKRKEAQPAIEKFNQVIRLDPQNAEAHFSLGVVHEARGQLQEADAAYRKAHDINPDRMDYKDAIVSLEAKSGKKQELDNKQEELNREVQEAAEAFKRREYLSAVELYKRLEEKFPKNAGYKYNIGTIYLMMKSPIQALEYYEKARKLNPKEERYVSACEKLKDVIGRDDEKRKAAEALWDQKEKEDKKQARKKETGGNRGKSQSKNQKAQRGNAPSGNQRLAPGFNTPGTAVFPGQPQQQQQRMPIQQGWHPEAGFAQSAGGQQTSFNPPGNLPQGSNFPPQGNIPAQGSNSSQTGNFQQPPNFAPQGNFQQPGNFPPPGNFPQPSNFNPQGNFQQPGNYQPQGNFGQGAAQQGGNFPPSEFQQQINQGFAPNYNAANQPDTQPRSPVASVKVLGPNALTTLGILAAPSPQGVTVTTIGIGSRAAKAGLNKGDIIVSIDGQNISSMSQLTSILSRKHEGESALMVINRKGKIGQIVF